MIKYFEIRVFVKGFLNPFVSWPSMNVWIKGPFVTVFDEISSFFGLLFSIFLLQIPFVSWPSMGVGKKGPFVTVFDEISS